MMAEVLECYSDLLVKTNRRSRRNCNEGPLESDLEGLRCSFLSNSDPGPASSQAAGQNEKVLIDTGSEEQMFAWVGRHRARFASACARWCVSWELAMTGSAI